MAVRRGDLQLANISLPRWYGSVKPNLVDSGIVMPLFRYDYERSDSTPGRHPDLPDVPAFSEVFKEVMGPGGVPSGERWAARQSCFRPALALSNSTLPRLRLVCRYLGFDLDFLRQ